MNSLDKIKPISEKIAAAILNRETLDLEEFGNFCEEDINYVLFCITDAGQRKERSRTKRKINKKKAWKAIIGKDKKRTKKKAL